MRQWEAVLATLVSGHSSAETGRNESKGSRRGSDGEEKEAREIYFDIYVKRGETSENRIKEVKNMCFSDRLSNHSFWGNFSRLLISSLAYEMFLLLKQQIAKTTIKEAHKWCVDSIRVRLLKIGATIRKTKRRVYYQLSKAFVHQNLFRQLITQ